jgi:hypothetical protein
MVLVLVIVRVRRVSCSNAASGRTMITSEWISEANPNRATYTGWGFDKPESMATGAWRIRIVADDGSSAEKAFVVEEAAEPAR